MTDIGPQVNKEFGQHYIVEFLECSPEKISHVSEVEKSFLKAAEESRATVISNYFYQFEPQGVTGVLLLAESHFTIHTWPEDKYAAVDIFTCGDMDADIAVRVLEKEFEAGKVVTSVVARGF